MKKAGTHMQMHNFGRSSNNFWTFISLAKSFSKCNDFG
jgi:hypothetical protein